MSDAEITEEDLRQVVLVLRWISQTLFWPMQKDILKEYVAMGDAWAALGMKEFQGLQQLHQYFPDEDLGDGFGIPSGAAENQVFERSSVAKLHGHGKGAWTVACPIDQLGNIFETTVVPYLIMEVVVAAIVLLARHSFANEQIVRESA